MTLVDTNPSITHRSLSSTDSGVAAKAVSAEVVSPGGGPASPAPPIRPLRDAKISEVIGYGLFSLVMLCIAGACIWLFGVSLFRDPSTPGGVAHLPILERIVLIFVIGLISLVPLTLLGRQLIWAYRKREELPETLLHNSVHAVPYGVLSLSMLFEYHKIVKGEAEGAAALASIIILFILSELGLLLFSEVREAKKVSRQLSDSLVLVSNTHQSIHTQLNGVQTYLQNVQDHLGNVYTGLQHVHSDVLGLPWVSKHAQLTSFEPAIPPRISRLFEIYEKLLGATPTGKESEMRQPLLRVLLTKYLEEEEIDIGGTLKPCRLPKGLTPPGSDYSEKVSFFATNIGFYAEFLRAAVREISKEIGGDRVPTRNPCLVAITNSLPSQFWNWPLDDFSCKEYEPISAYRAAQFDAVSKGYTRLFRLILLSNEQVTPEGSRWLRSQATPALWTEGEWERQREWTFLFAENDPENPLTLGKQGTYPVDPDYLPGSLLWTRKSPKETGDAYWIAQQQPKEPSPIIKYENVWKHYCRRMHLTRLGSALATSGRTEIGLIDTTTFTAEWGTGFASCPDLMFIGTSDSTADDAWSDPTVKWGIALMTSMSSQTETMFLLVIHDASLIEQLWQDALKARSQLIKIITDSDKVIRELP